jgi:hypothetical protein
VSAPVVAVDRFPVIVHTPGGAVYRDAKVIMTRPVDGVGSLKAWAAADHPPVVDTTFDLDNSDVRSRQVDWSLDTPDGVVVVQPSPGCGCGNRLKYWTPPEFTPMRMGKLR